MRKHYFIILAFIFLLFPLKVNANQLATLNNLPPVISSSSFNTITSFASLMPDVYLNSSGIAPIQDSFIETYNNATSSSLSFNYDFTYKPFTQINWQPAFPLWDSQGNEVPLANAGLCTGTGQAGSVYFLYDTTTGEILKLGESFGTSISTLNYVADTRFKANLLTITDNFGPTNSANPLAIFDDTTATAQQIATYESLPYSSYTYWDSGNYYFCPNGNLPGTLISVNTSSSQQQFYANDDGKDLINYKWEYGSRSFWIPGTYVIDGYTYTYKAFGGTSFGVNRNNCKMYNYNSNDLVADDATYYNPCSTETLPDTINYDKYIAMPISKSSSVNPNYNPNNTPSINNNPINVNIIYPSNPSPDYNYIKDYHDSTDTPQSNPNENPTITNPYPDIDDSEIGDSIPIVQGLQNKFPFSIPWDIYNIIKGFEVERETPVLEWEIYLPVIDYTWEVNIDMTMYNETAELFRTLFLLLFIVGLALFSYKHFFGQ